MNKLTTIFYGNYDKMSALMDKPFSEWLETMMNSKGWNQSDLARASGLSRQAVSGYVNNRRLKPDEDALKKIAKAFKLPPETVYRIAGLLPNIKPRDSKREILLHLADQLSDEDYTEVVRYTELRLAIAEEKGKYARSAPQGST